MDLGEYCLICDSILFYLKAISVAPTKFLFPYLITVKKKIISILEIFQKKYFPIPLPNTM